MAVVRMWMVIKATRKVAYNIKMRTDRFDAGSDDSLTVSLWDKGANPAKDSPTWYWNSWAFFDNPRDKTRTTSAVKSALSLLGPVNGGDSGTQVVYYSSDEETTGASKTTAPSGGWTNELVLADTHRKPVALQVSQAGVT